VPDDLVVRGGYSFEQVQIGTPPLAPTTLNG
jgi:hypothetical protein